MIRCLINSPAVLHQRLNSEIRGSNPSWEVVILCHTNMIFLSLSLLTWHKKTGVGTFKPRVYKLTLLDEAQVTLQLQICLSDLVLRFLVGLPLLVGKEAQKIVSAGF